MTYDKYGIPDFRLFLSSTDVERIGLMNGNLFRGLIKQGVLEGYRIGKRLVATKQYVLDYLENNAVRSA